MWPAMCMMFGALAKASLIARAGTQDDTGRRVQAAIECLDRILTGEAAEKVLTGWARGSRYAGSKDRAAVRDHVYDVLRSKRACAAFGDGSESGRA